MAEELDDIGRETAAMMRQMLQLATLVALRTRERGQKEAEARVKMTEARQKEARERQLREAADSKAKDPRNVELARMIEKPPLDKGVSLEKDRFAAQAEATRMAATQAAMSKPLVRYDSVERRAALAQHLTRMGIAPELAAVRMLLEVGQAQSAADAVRARQEEAAAVQRRAREQEARGLQRVRS
ncbi:hypothetical protein IU501_20170 [Nocardia otitidiscaviarum]|uniref:Uncharacterized protein n=1 Tax=Nocardia otitidiscaviarum TaxID=1823 RepID=A0A516NMY5_9NOCA|nr:hypothetical protein [Nocardia otitidiscaviarum]MBF6135305.1 hypothetical protein [Nocardia otitidiscaviarum]MBF6487126.1 hypothetical protein [Nocardia otitidiscaviarum]MCP9624486.1 hypothetical protein [Nocardia otitidiscaviarum]QDP80257.1 hypothetical protein FOH10_17605 [Nocardia otitidiscaviarum]